MQETLFGDSCTPKKRRPAPSGPHVDAMRVWGRLWYETRGVTYEFSPIDHRFLKLGLNLAGSLEAWSNAARKLLTDPPSAWHAQEASPRLVYTRWNNLKVTVRPTSRDERNLQSLRTALESL